MNAITRYIRDRFLATKDPTAGMTQRAVYDFGYQNGYAWGEVVGRKQAFEDLIEHLRLMGRTLDDVQPADVLAVRAKSTH